jgi:4-amino-4-deoxy-L-arabinose transferase-like glycosyltransferase
MRMQRKRPLPFSNLKFLPLFNFTLFCFAAAYLVIYFWLAVQRMRYPFELEWIEGGMVDQVQRLVHGQNMYAAPSINYVPYLYPPLYFYLSALASLIFGSGFFPLRLVSVIASLVSFVVIFMIVHAETRDKWAALLSTGLFAAVFRVTGAWLDIARVDSLFLAFWLLFVYFARGRQSWKSAVLVGIFAGLAYLTKQTALITCLPVLAYLFWRNWKQALLASGIAALIVGITTLILDLSSSGWYSYYIFGLLSQQTEWLPLQFITFWKNDLAVHVPLAILILLFFLAGRPRQDRPSLILWLCILAGALAGTFISRVKVGGYDNVLMPLYAAIALLFGLGLSALIRTVRLLSVEYKGRLEGLVMAAVLVQFVMLFYNPFAQLPTGRRP